MFNEPKTTSNDLDVESINIGGVNEINNCNLNISNIDKQDICLLNVINDKDPGFQNSKDLLVGDNKNQEVLNSRLPKAINDGNPVNRNKEFPVSRISGDFMVQNKDSSISLSIESQVFRFNENAHSIKRQKVVNFPISNNNMERNTGGINNIYNKGNNYPMNDSDTSITIKDNNIKDNNSSNNKNINKINEKTETALSHKLIAHQSSNDRSSILSGYYINKEYMSKEHIEEATALSQNDTENQSKSTDKLDVIKSQLTDKLDAIKGQASDKLNVIKEQSSDNLNVKKQLANKLDVTVDQPSGYKPEDNENSLVTTPNSGPSRLIPTLNDKNIKDTRRSKAFRLEVINPDFLKLDLSKVTYVIDRFDSIFIREAKELLATGDESNTDLKKSGGVAEKKFSGVPLFSLIYQRLHEETEYLKYSIKDSFKDLIKILPRVPYNFCDICGYTGTTSNNNTVDLVSCFHCNVTVHKACYGIFNTETEPHNFVCFSCTECLVYVKCILCVNEGGATFPFTICNIDELENNKLWCHFTCILYNKNIHLTGYGTLSVDNNVFKDIECAFCKYNDGAVIKCSESGCQMWYHVYCGLLNAYISKKSNKTFCENHAGNVKRREPNQELNYTLEYLDAMFDVVPNTYIMDMIISSDLSELDIPYSRKKEIVCTIYNYYNIKQQVLSEGGGGSFGKVDLERTGDWFDLRSLFSIPNLNKFNLCESNADLTGPVALVKDPIKVYEISEDITKIKLTNDMVSLPLHVVKEYVEYINTLKVIKEKEDKLVKTKNKLLQLSEEGNTQRKRVKKTPQAGVQKTQEEVSDKTINHDHGSDEEENTASIMEMITESNMQTAKNSFSKTEKKKKSEPIYWTKQESFLQSYTESHIKKDTNYIKIKDVEKEMDKSAKKRVKINDKNYTHPFSQTLSHNKMIDCLNTLDVEEFSLFKNEVTEEIAPGYFSVIEEPMCFNQIRIKLKDDKYTYKQFIKDMSLIVRNCKLYNKGYRPYVRKAESLEKRFRKLISD
ncbi:Protein Jade-1 [Cucumispora dikerogammari]|nr:Protein Jade-1 [Cucumispora dikerogammari]